MLSLLVGPRIIKAGFKIVAVLRSAVFGPESISYKWAHRLKSCSQRLRSFFELQKLGEGVGCNYTFYLCFMKWVPLVVITLSFCDWESLFSKDYYQPIKCP